MTGPIPDGPWDLIHERLVLQHVPARLDVLDQLVVERGGANNFAADAWRDLRQRGLTETGASGHVVFDRGGDGFTQVMAANARQVRDGLAQLGIAAEDVDQFLAVLADPDTIIDTSVLIAAWGRLPA